MSDSPFRITLEFAERPWTTNAERKGSHWERAARTKKWREAFFWLAKQASVPTMGCVEITIEPWQAKGILMDTAACHPAAKAAIDGIVDAGVIPDDSSKYVAGIRFLPTRKGKDALILVIDEVRN